MASKAYRLVGTKLEAYRSDRRSAILAILPQAAPGLTVEEILEAWPDENPGPGAGDGHGQTEGAGGVEGVYRPSASSIRRTLERAQRDGAVRTTGTGNKSDPFRYFSPQAS